MISPPVYINSADYVSGLNFEYIETYSFQRDTEFMAWQDQQRAIYTRLSAIEKKRGLTVDETVQFAKVKRLGSVRYLIDEDGKFHPSSRLTHTFKKTDKQVGWVMGVLQAETIDIPAWMCAPLYRDAIVFYNGDGSRTSVLNICFSCQYMATETFNIDADVRVYNLLKQFFIELGHPIDADR